MDFKLLILLVLCGLPLIAAGDGTGEIAPICQMQPSEEIIAETKEGALLPYPTYQVPDDGCERPKYWNGYGVDPCGPNYYCYFDKYPCAYDVVFELTSAPEMCKDKKENNKSKPKPKRGRKPEPKIMPEPNLTILMSFGVMLWMNKMRIKWV